MEKGEPDCNALRLIGRHIVAGTANDGTSIYIDHYERLAAFQERLRVRFEYLSLKAILRGMSFPNLWGTHREVQLFKVMGFQGAKFQRLAHQVRLRVESRIHFLILAT
jgi:hypothetical protein